MWKIENNGRLIQTTDESRVKFRTNVSQINFGSIKYFAIENDTHVNYLIENGLQTVISSRSYNI